MTIYRKIACAVHVVIVALLLSSSLWSVAVPASEGTKCALEPYRNDQYTSRFLTGLIKLVNWWGVGFFVQSFPCCIKNVALLVAVLLGASYINVRFTSDMVNTDPDRIPVECFSGLVMFVVIFCAVEAVVLVLLVVDKRVSISHEATQQQQMPQGENQPLLNT